MKDVKLILLVTFGLVAVTVSTDGEADEDPRVKFMSGGDCMSRCLNSCHSQLTSFTTVDHDLNQPQEYSETQQGPIIHRQEVEPRCYFAHSMQYATEEAQRLLFGKLPPYHC